jgi:phage anti-repressor protein
MAEMMLEQFGQIARSTEQYPVDFDQAWQWIGYSRKGDALNVLKANFEEGADFDSRRSENQKSTDLDFGINRNQDRGWGGDRKSVYYFLAVDCFKSFCMMAGTDKGREVRKYYLQIEKKYLESHVRETTDLAAINAFIKESVPRIKLLTSENVRLRQMNRLYEEKERLREQLARKNTPLTESEKRQILACSTHWSVAGIARFTNRSEAAVRRVLNGRQ